MFICDLIYDLLSTPFMPLQVLVDARVRLEILRLLLD